MKKVWIKNTHLGLKRIIFLEIIFLIFLNFLYKNYLSLFWFVFGAILILNFWIVYLIYQNGVVVLQKSFSVFKKKLSVVDYHNYKNSSIVRSIVSLGEKGTHSALFIKNNKNKWAYHDTNRAILNNSKIKPKKTLVLGGGGGALPITLAQKFKQNKIDVVELSKEMINIANSYFLSQVSKKIKNKIKIINNDAFSFIKEKNKVNGEAREGALGHNKYDLIIVDIFNDTELHKKVYSQEFIKDLKSRGKIIIVNFGSAKNEKSSQLNVIFNKYIKSWDKSAIYLANGNFIGLFGVKIKKGNINFQKIY